MKNLFLMLLSALGFCTACSASDGSKVEVLEPKVFIEMANSDTTAVILDVRRPDEFANGHLAEAVNLDWLNEDVFAKGMSRLDKSRTYYIYCRSGRRSNAAAVKMQAEGFKVFDMKGGYLKWAEQGFPTVR